MKENKIKVAIMGSGPAGFYAAEHLQKKLGERVHIDMFDKLPTPHGLVRSGVAPDHQKIKSVTRIYDKIASNPNFRFFGLVEFGKHLTIDDLKNYYHQIVFATGAQTDRRMNIPGEDLKGSHTATEFVAWYNGHPEYTAHEFDLSKEKVAIVGMGNVAVDVARILCRTKKELGETDIADYAFDKLINSNVKEVYMLGRRGPAQAAFTNPELRELTKLEDANLITHKKEVELDDLTSSKLEEKPDRTAEIKIVILKEASENTPSKSKNLTIRFLVSPVEIIGDDDGNVSKIKLVKNELYKSDNGSIRPRATGSFEDLDVDIVFRSIGYHGIPLPGLPFREDWGIIPNIEGRVTDGKDGVTVKGIYVTGWIKRGPTGVIGTNKTDSGETVKCMVQDIENNEILIPAKTERNDILNLINERQPKYVSYEDWLKIDEIEKKKGEDVGRPRLKFTNIDEILEALKK